jgi:hypothetical protein
LLDLRPQNPVAEFQAAPRDAPLQRKEGPASVPLTKIVWWGKIIGFMPY